MIIGNGDLASVLPESDTLTFFASGVSDSSCDSEIEFNREIELLKNCRAGGYNKRLVYFSSLSIYYKDSPYTKHKKYMEMLVRTSFTNFTIIRLGNIDWGTNPKTIINHFRNSPTLKIWEGTRYIINKEEFLHWINLIPNFNTEMNLTGQLMTTKQIYNKYRNE